MRFYMFVSHAMPKKAKRKVGEKGAETDFFFKKKSIYNVLTLS